MKNIKLFSMVGINSTDKFSMVFLFSTVLLIGTITPAMAQTPVFPFQNPVIVDVNGNPITTVLTGQEILFRADLTNLQTTEQPFAYAVQIVSVPSNVQISYSWITGSLSSGQAFSPALSWMSVCGDFTVNFFAYDNIIDKNLLATPLSLSLTVSGCMPPNTQTLPTIKITKNATNADGAFNFTILNATDITNSTAAFIPNTAINNMTAPLSVIPGFYNVTEIIPAGWTLNNANCEKNGVSLGTILNFEVSLGDTIECVFENSKMPIPHDTCGSTNPNLFVTTENTLTANTFGGAMISEVIVCDPDIAGTADGKGEPDVTVNGRALRMAQDTAGLWHGYFADKIQAQLADQNVLTPGTGLDFGYFCSNQSTVPINSPFSSPFSDTLGIALPVMTTIPGSQGNAPLMQCSGVPSSPNHNNVIHGFPPLNPGPTNGPPAGIGQIDISNNDFWPFVQLYDLNQFSGSVIVQYNKGGGVQSTSLTFDSASLTVDSDGDGVTDSVDSDPTNASSTFSDVLLGGTTLGTINSIGDQILLVTEQSNPDGVLITASLWGGATPATVTDCDGTIYTISPGDVIVVTCGSSIVQVIHGPIEVEYFVSGNSFATTILDTGDAVIFDQDILTFTNNGAESVEVIVNGETVIVNSDEAVFLSNDTPRIIKQNMKNELSSLIVIDKKDQKRIDKAYKAIGKSLEDKLWVDDSTLTKNGKKVFDEDKKAVKELLKVKFVDVSSIVKKLVDVDQTLAQTYIDSIPVDTGDKKINKELTKANKEMDKAQKELSKGKFDKAIDHYKKAWVHAQKAINHDEKDDKHDEKDDKHDEKDDKHDEKDDKHDEKDKHHDDN